MSDRNDPRDAGGSMFDAGDPHARGQVMFDARRMVLVEQYEVAVAHGTSGGEPMPDRVALVCREFAGLCTAAWDRLRAQGLTAGRAE